jgi:hypothetical protein
VNEIEKTRPKMMSRKEHISTLIILGALLALIPSSAAWAYIDPGTGSYMLQILLAFFLGALFALKMFWKNVKSFLGHLFSRRKKQATDDR